MAMATSAPLVGGTATTHITNPPPPVSSGPPQTVGLVQQFVESTGQLYSLPAAAAEVLRLTGEPTIDIKAIKDCVASDPALAARILRVANSSLFGPSRQVTDLNQALTLLGIRPLKILVLGFSLPKELFSGLEAQVLSWYWRHTLIKAVAARELAERQWHIPGDEPFLAGLVQDIGILALIQQLGQPYHRLLSHVQTHGGSLLAHELETLGFDHLVLSARLLSHWGLPPGLCAAVSVPPDAQRIGSLSRDERTLPQMLHLSELLARLIEQPYGSALHELLQAGASYCGLHYESLQALVTALQAKVGDLADVLSLELPTGTSYVDLLLSAHARLADETLVVSARFEQAEISQLASELQRELSTATRRGGLSQSRVPPNHPALPVPISRPTTKPTVATPNSPPGRADHANLLTRLPHLLEAARQERSSLSLALFEVERFADLVFQLGPGGAREAVALLAEAMGDWAGPAAHAAMQSDSRVALICRGSSRQDTVEVARQIVTSAKSWSQEKLPLSFELSLSAGLAALDVPPRNYPATDLVAAAERCLTAARLSGGNTVKSIGL